MEISVFVFREDQGTEGVGGRLDGRSRIEILDRRRFGGVYVEEDAEVVVVVEDGPVASLGLTR